MYSIRAKYWKIIEVTNFDLYKKKKFTPILTYYIYNSNVFDRVGI